MKLKNKIPELIKGKQISKIARAMESANQTVRNCRDIEYFDGDNQEAIGTLIKIANVLNVPFFDLFEEVSE